MRSQTKAQLLLLAVVAVWGATFVLVKNALRDASPLAFNLLRMGTATVALAAYNWRDLRGLTRKAVLAGLVVGGFLAAGYQLQTAGLDRTTAAKSAFITGLVVVFVPLLTVIPRLRPAGTAAPGPATFAGAAMAFSGLLLLTTPAGTSWTKIFATIGVGDLLTLACSIAFAGHLLSLAHASLRVRAGLLATLQIGVATLLMALTVRAAGPPMLHLTSRLAIAVAITSLFGTAAAFTIQSYAQQHLQPTQTALLVTMEPVFAWITAAIILHERLGQRGAAGAGMILAGIAIIELIPHVANRRATRLSET